MPVRDSGRVAVAIETDTGRDLRSQIAARIV